MKPEPTSQDYRNQKLLKSERPTTPPLFPPSCPPKTAPPRPAPPASPRCPPPLGPRLRAALSCLLTAHALTTHRHGQYACAGPRCRQRAEAGRRCGGGLFLAALSSRSRDAELCPHRGLRGGVQLPCAARTRFCFQREPMHFSSA